MNALVLAIAGTLVVVGMALIVLSFVLARKQAGPEEPVAAAPTPVTDADLAFIDQPLQADMASALGHSTPSATDDDPTEETSGVAPGVHDDPENDTGGSTRPDDKED